MSLNSVADTSKINPYTTGENWDRVKPASRERTGSSEEKAPLKKFLPKTKVIPKAPSYLLV